MSLYKKWQRFALLVLWCAALYFCLFHFFTSNRQAKGTARGCTVRFTQSLSQNEAETLRENAASVQGGSFWPTFWTQRAVSIERPGRDSVDVSVIAYNGDPWVVWAATYTSGTAPAAVVDGELPQIAASDTLAWQLYGSLDATGMELTVEGHPYTVIGTFRADDAMLLVPAPLTYGFDAAEVCGDFGRADAVQSIQDWLTFSGTSADYIADGRGIAGFYMAALCCFLALAFWDALQQGVFLLPRLPRLAKKILLLCGALLAALCLPALLARVPLWLLPDRWSNFSFWKTLFATLRARLNDWLALVPTVRDVFFKWLLVKQTAALAGSLLLLFPFNPFSKWKRAAN